MNFRGTFPRPPQLAYVVHSLDPGGAERLVVDMSIAFSNEYRVVVFCLDSPGAWAADLRQEGIPVHCVWRQPGFDIAASARLAHGFRKYKADLVHSHQCTPWFYSALSRLRYSAPRLLLEEHGRFFPEPDSKVSRVANRLLISRLTDRFIAVSADVRDRLVRYEGLTAASIDVIYNGVHDAPELSMHEREKIRQELGFSRHDFVVGAVGRLDAIKNLPMLLKALASLARSNPRVKGLIVGDGPMYEKLHSLSSRLGLADRVKMTRFRPDARRLTACMDVFVLCSFSEGTSMALLESMAAGVPVIVTNVGGNPEIVQDNVTGRIVESDDVGALEATIRSAFQDPKSFARLAANGRRRYEEKFSFAAMLNHYRAVYNSILHSRQQQANDDS